MFEFLLPPRQHRKRRSSPRKASPPEELSLPGGALVFSLQRDHCRTLRLTVKPDGSVKVKAPARVALDDILRFVSARLDWIRKKQAFFLEHRGSAVDYRNGGTVLFLGRPFLLSLLPTKRRSKPRLVGSRLELPCRSDAAEHIEAACKAWRLGLAKIVLSRRLIRLDAQARTIFQDRASISSLTVRSLKRRWGSCSVRGEITLAAQLIELPLPLIDYVLCHELCHLRHMNHGPAFHAALLRMLPDAREREKAVRIWSLEHPRT